MIISYLLPWICSECGHENEDEFEYIGSKLDTMCLGCSRYFTLRYELVIEAVIKEQSDR